jgi:hypothetical protein
MFIITISVVFILALLYMLSRLLNKREWEALAKTEMWQTANALIWVVVIGAFATLLCTFSCQASGDESPFTTAAAYLGSVQNNFETAVSTLLDTAKAMHIKSAYALSMFGTMVSPYEGCSVLANDYEQMSAIMAPFIGSVIIQRFALMTISGIAFTLLLPIGVILRLLPFAREAGASVIALAVGLYIVLPLTYVFAERATSSISIAVEAPSSWECIDQGAVKTTFSTIGNAFPQAVFFPALSMIITMAAIRVLSKIFMYDFLEMRG